MTPISFPLAAAKAIFSVARNFLSEIADFSRIYRQFRQVFGSKSRKIRQFLPTINGKIDPSPQKFQFLLHFYPLIIFKIQKVKIKLVFEKKIIIFFFKSFSFQIKGIIL